LLFLSALGCSPCFSWLVLSFRPVGLFGFTQSAAWLPSGFSLAAPGCFFSAPGCYWLFLASPGPSQLLQASWLFCSWLFPAAFGWLLVAPGCFSASTWRCSWLLLAVSFLLLAATSYFWLLLASPDFSKHHGFSVLGCSWLLLAGFWLLLSRLGYFPCCFPCCFWQLSLLLLAGSIFLSGCALPVHPVGCFSRSRLPFGFYLAVPGCFFSAPGCSWLLLAISGFSWSLVASPGILWPFCSWLFLVALGWPLAAPGSSWLLPSAPGISPCCSWLVLSFYPVVLLRFTQSVSWLLSGFYLGAPGCFFSAPGCYWLFLSSPGLS
jgi:hypothetical protein